MALTDPFLGLIYKWAFGESGWDSGMDANLQRLGATVQIAVKSKAMNITDIITPNELDRYIVPSGGTGVFAGKTDQLAYYRDAAWFFIVPKDGWQAYVIADDQMVVYKTASSAWVVFGAPVTGAGFADSPNDGGYYVRKNNSWLDGRQVVPIINNQSGLSYTLVANDRNAIVRMSNDAPNSVVIPPNASVTLPVGTCVQVTQTGVGITTIIPGSGVTINCPEALTLYRRYAYITLRKVATDTWDVVETSGGAGGNGGNPSTAIAFSANITIDFRVNNKFAIDLTGDATITFTGGFAGQQINLRLKQDATGSRNVVWGAGVRFGTDIANTALTVTPLKTDYVAIIFNESSNTYDLVSLIRGF